MLLKTDDAWFAAPGEVRHSMGRQPTFSRIGRILRSCGTIERLMLSELLLVKLFILFEVLYVLTGSSRCTEDSIPALYFRNPVVLYVVWQ